MSETDKAELASALAEERRKIEALRDALSIDCQQALEDGTTGVTVFEIHRVRGKIKRVRKKADELLLEEETPRKEG